MIMREDFRAVTRLPVLTQFLLAPFPALLAGLAYGAWQWTQSNSARSHDYHVLGWEVLPLIGIAGVLFTAAIGRGVRGRSSERLLAATLLTVAATLVMAYARAASLTG